MILSFWRALSSFWWCVRKHSYHMAKLLVFSILQGQHIQCCDTTSRVGSDMMGAVCSSSFSCVSLAMCILVTKEAYFSLSTNRQAQDLQPMPLLQTEWISWSKSLVSTGLLQKVIFVGCELETLWQEIPSTLLWSGWSMSSSNSKVLIHHNRLLSDLGISLGISRPFCLLGEVSLPNLILLGQAGALGQLQQGFW